MQHTHTHHHARARAHRAHTHTLTHRLVFIEAVSSHFPVVGFKHSTLLSVLSAESNPPTAYSRPFRAARPSARRCASDATLLHTPVRLSKHSTVVTPATAWPPTANNLPHPSARREYLRKEYWGQTHNTSVSDSAEVVHSPPHNPMSITTTWYMLYSSNSVYFSTRVRTSMPVTRTGHGCRARRRVLGDRAPVK